MTTTTLDRRVMLRHGLLTLAGVRAVLAIAAIPLAPVLYREHFVVLVLLRPTKEVLLAAGFLARKGDVNLGVVVLAAIPLAVFAVWHFFWLGRAFGPELEKADSLPRWSRRLLPPDRIESLCRVLDKRGEKVVVLGRLAAFPSTMLGAAAGASGMDAPRFLAADAVGAVLSLAEVIAAGYVLGAAYKQAGPWLTAAGVAVLAAVLVYVGRSLRRA